MSKPHFAVPISDLEWGPKAVSFEVSEAWLGQALQETDAATRGPGRLEVEFTKNGREVMVRGRVICELSMPCVVTMDPVQVHVNAEIFLLLAPAAARTTGSSKKLGPGRARAKGWSQDPELSNHDAALDVYEGTEVVLDGFLREFILLELPLFPKRSDLPSEKMPAIPPAVEGDEEAAIDPRLLPLAALKSRLSPK